MWSRLRLTVQQFFDAVVPITCSFNYQLTRWQKATIDGISNLHEILLLLLFIASILVDHTDEISESTRPEYIMEWAPDICLHQIEDDEGWIWIGHDEP